MILIREGSKPEKFVCFVLKEKTGSFGEKGEGNDTCLSSKASQKIVSNYFNIILNLNGKSSIKMANKKCLSLFKSLEKLQVILVLP